jgi:uncharacterized protein (TIGR02145 family)
MAENIAYQLKEGNSWAYDNNSKYVKDYGYLYDWESAQKVCPSGWHLPTDKEWQIMVSFLGGDRQASEKIRERGYNHWVDGYSYRPIATNESGFSARPGGQRNDKGKYFGIGTYGKWWAASPKNESLAVYYWLGYMGDYLNKDQIDKNSGLCVRCVKD